MKIDENRLYSPREVITENGGVIPISLSAVYAAIERGEIKSKRIGNRILIPGKILIKFIEVE